jgi:tRNA-dihydrouridine synthase B
MMTEPTFFVGDVPVYGDVILAPMAGYSDVPYRALCRAYGSAMHYTEFVPVEALLGRRVHPRFAQRLEKQTGERPFTIQIFGNDAHKLLRAAQRVAEWGPDIIDVNMGCSTRKVSGRGAGAGMMPQPALVAETFRLISTHLSIPVSGKIRLGWDEEQKNFREIAHIMVDNGASLIAMHGRTKAQKYDGRADWEAIAELRQTVAVPVIGNGDVQSPADIDRMKTQTGCDAVMVGRAAIGNPWIFARRDKTALAPVDVIAAIRLHLTEMLVYYGRRDGLLLFRKHLKQYFADDETAVAWLPALLITKDADEFLALLEEMETAVTPAPAAA